jgi:CPA2 family monovalent cation:H+ antiporter-2
MLFNPSSLLKAPLVVAMILAVVLVGKPLTAAFTVRLLGKPTAMAIPIGAAFSQVGEFSFILGTAAHELGLINDTGWSALIAASIISIGLNPSIYRWARRFSMKAAPMTPVSPGLRPAIDPNHCILVGYGPVGRIIHRILADRGAAVTVVELNLDTVRRLRSEGRTALYGDVLRPGTLGEAGIATAGSLILSADVEDAAEIIRQARLLNPDLRVLVRCSHVRDAARLYRAGAAVVAAGEAEVAVALAEAVSASDEIDQGALARRRDDIRRHLYDAP